MPQEKDIEVAEEFHADNVEFSSKEEELQESIEDFYDLELPQEENFYSQENSSFDDLDFDDFSSDDLKINNSEFEDLDEEINQEENIEEPIDDLEIDDLKQEFFAEESLNESKSEINEKTVFDNEDSFEGMMSGLATSFEDPLADYKEHEFDFSQDDTEVNIDNLDFDALQSEDFSGDLDVEDLKQDLLNEKLPDDDVLETISSPKEQKISPESFEAMMSDLTNLFDDEEENQKVEEEIAEDSTTKIDEEFELENSKFDEFLFDEELVEDTKVEADFNEEILNDFELLQEQAIEFELEEILEDEIKEVNSTSDEPKNTETKLDVFDEIFEEELNTFNIDELVDTEGGFDLSEEIDFDAEFLKDAQELDSIMQTGEELSDDYLLSKDVNGQIDENSEDFEEVIDKSLNEMMNELSAEFEEEQEEITFDDSLGEDDDVIEDNHEDLVIHEILKEENQEFAEKIKENISNDDLSDDVFSFMDENTENFDEVGSFDDFIDEDLEIETTAYATSKITEDVEQIEGFEATYHVASEQEKAEEKKEKRAWFDFELPEEIEMLDSLDSEKSINDVKKEKGYVEGTSENSELSKENEVSQEIEESKNEEVLDAELNDEAIFDNDELLDDDLFEIQKEQEQDDLEEELNQERISNAKEITEFQNVVSKNVQMQEEQDLLEDDFVQKQSEEQDLLEDDFVQKQSEELDTEFSYVTPTLASLYESQEVYDKALYYFQILNNNGKYDEKIAELEKKIEELKENE